MQDEAEKQAENLKSMMSDIKVGQMVYDKVNNLIWLRMAINVTGVGPVSGISGLKPTKKGMIQTSCYVETNQFNEYESLFQDIAVSVKPDPDLRYNPLLDDTGSSSPFYLRVVIGAIIGGLVALILGLFRKKKQ